MVENKDITKVDEIKGKFTKGLLKNKKVFIHKR